MVGEVAGGWGIRQEGKWHTVKESNLARTVLETNPKPLPGVLLNPSVGNFALPVNRIYFT
jgi:hypothetical protein